MLVIPRKDNISMDELNDKLGKKLGAESAKWAVMLMNRGWFFVSIDGGKKLVFFEPLKKVPLGTVSSRRTPKGLHSVEALAESAKYDYICSTLEKDKPYCMRVEPPPLPAAIVSCLDSLGCEVVYPRRGECLFVRPSKKDPHEPTWLPTTPKDYRYQ